MKKYLHFLVLVFLVILTMINCSKIMVIQINTPNDFNVSSTDSVFFVGDTIKFDLTGRPDQIVFYSGETGMRYANANRSTDTSGYAKLVFQTSVQQGVLTNGDSLQLLVSSNLKGYDKTSVRNATWSDITKRNTKWPTAVNTSFTTSDSIVLTDFKKADSINIAFRYIGKKSATVQQRWRIQGFSLVHNLPDGTKTGLFAAPQNASGVATSAFAYTGWVQVSMANDTTTGFNVWNVGAFNQSSTNTAKTANGITITGAYPLTFDPGPALSNEPNDDWVITSKVSLKQVKPDFGASIKNAVAVSMQRFNALPTAYYKLPGTYTATFVAINQNIDESKQVVKQVKFRVKSR
jgi:hypothetical protein